MIDPTTLRWEAYNSFGLQAGFNDADEIVLYRTQTNKTGEYVYSYDAETIDDIISNLPVYNNIDDLYLAISINSIGLNDRYKGNGYFLYVTQQDIDNSENQINETAKAYVEKMEGEGDTISDQVKTALNTFFNKLQRSGLLSKIKVFWLYAGNTENSAEINAINPDIHRLVFTGVSSTDFSKDGWDAVRNGSSAMTDVSMNELFGSNKVSSFGAFSATIINPEGFPLDIGASSGLEDRMIMSKFWQHSDNSFVPDVPGKGDGLAIIGRGPVIAGVNFNVRGWNDGKQITNSPRAATENTYSTSDLVIGQAPKIYYGHFISDYIRLGEVYKFSQYFEEFNNEIERPFSILTDTNKSFFFGDSITEGWIGSGTENSINRWTNLLCSNKSFSQYNFALTNTRLQNDYSNGGAPTTSMYDRVNEIPEKTSTCKYLFFMYGVNDLLQLPFDPVKFVNQYDYIISKAINLGWSNAEIKVCSPTYFNTTVSQTDIQSLTAAISSYCSSKNIQFFDVYNEMLNNGADTLLRADLVHLNDDGNNLIATLIGDNII